MDQAVFNVDNFRNAQCSESEIGAQWEDRWSLIDAMNALCLDDQVGTAKGATPDAGNGDPDWSIPVWQCELKAYRANPERYRATSASSLNKLLEIEARQLDREAAAKAGRIEKPPSECSLAELERRTLNALGIVDEHGSPVPYTYRSAPPCLDVEFADVLERGIRSMTRQRAPIREATADFLIGYLREKIEAG